jgi:hypothetical protein
MSSQFKTGFIITLGVIAAFVVIGLLGKLLK